VLVEQALGISVPTPEEMLELEPSSRLYQDDGATFMTAMVLVGPTPSSPTPSRSPSSSPGPRLVTVRYIEPKSFALFTAQAARQPRLCPDGPRTFLGAAGRHRRPRLPRAQHHRHRGRPHRAPGVLAQPGDFNRVLVDLGRAQTVNADIREAW
jgi:magnesium transporter